MTRIKLGITHGDINGISYEIIIKAFSDLKKYNSIIPIIYGSPKIFGYYKKQTNININSILIKNIDEAKNIEFYMINCNSDDIKVDVGVSNEMSGLASYQAIEKSYLDLKEKKIDILITNPVNSNNINEAGFDFVNHSNYFASKFKVNNYVEILIKDDLKIALVNDTLPATELKEIVTKELIVNKLELLNNTLIDDFLIRKPKIAVLGINPFINKNIVEDDTSKNIISAIESAKARGIMAFGSYKADDFFENRDYIKFDAVLAMHYEQAYIPFKLIAYEYGVKYTAGLPFILTAPINETSYHISGKNIANEISLKNAVYLALDIIKNREFQAEAEENRLKVGDFAEDIKEINKIGE